MNLLHGVLKMVTLFCLLLAIALATAPVAMAQPAADTARRLTRPETDSVFSDSLVKALRISLPIRAAFTYNDASGPQYLVLTESRDTVIARTQGSGKPDTLHYTIKAYNMRHGSKGWVKGWELTDFRLQSDRYGNAESSIWFWTRYLELKDQTGDKLADPILVYGSATGNGISEGRVKILIYYKGRKVAVRHQNSDMDSGRNTTIDKAFYALPPALQKRTRQIMQKISDDGNAIFPYGWQKAMDAKKLYHQEK